MNCLEFRRRLFRQPDSRDPAFLHHRLECKSCAVKAAELSKFDRQLSVAFSVGSPAELPVRLICRHRLLMTRNSAANRPRLYALAASVLLVIAVGAIWIARGAVWLSEDVIAHVREQPHLPTSAGSVSETGLTTVLSTVGAEHLVEPGSLLAASVCEIRGKSVAHLVFDGQEGPVDVVLMPEESVSSRHLFSSKTKSGLLMPVRSGSMAIVGEPGEVLASTEADIRSVIRWQL